MVTRLRTATFILLLTSAPAFAQTPTTAQPPVIVAQGHSELKAAPDQAWAIVALETRDDDAPEARRLGAVAMTSVMAALRSAGLADDAIKTIGYSLNPEYEYVNGRQRMKGFIVANRVQVRIDDITKVADVLDAVGGLSLPGSTTVTVAGLRFDLKDRADLERRALRAAVEDAMASAQAMADGARAALGRISRIDQVGSMQKGYEMQPRPAMMASRSSDMAVETPIAPSEVVVQASVVLTVEIK
jgi:uncharacterized protein YggE